MDGAERTREFRQMVAALHTLGLRVVLDVVYNHTFHSGATTTETQHLTDDLYVDPGRKIQVRGLALFVRVYCRRWQNPIGGVLHIHHTIHIMRADHTAATLAYSTLFLSLLISSMELWQPWACLLPVVPLCIHMQHSAESHSVCLQGPTVGIQSWTRSCQAITTDWSWMAASAVRYKSSS